MYSLVFYFHRGKHQEICPAEMCSYQTRALGYHTVTVCLLVTSKSYLWETHNPHQHILHSSLREFGVLPSSCLSCNGRFFWTANLIFIFLTHCNKLLNSSYLNLFKQVNQHTSPDIYSLWSRLKQSSLVFYRRRRRKQFANNQTTLLKLNNISKPSDMAKEGLN